MEQRRTHKLTFEDYLGLPSDGRRYEILHGELEVTPSPLFEHQDIQGTLFGLIWMHLRRSQEGKVVTSPMDVILAPDTICQPDILYVRSERVPDIVRDRIWGAPDLVVEILSPSTSRRDRITKAEIYARFGITEYWIVDPVSKEVLRHVLVDNRYPDPQILRKGESVKTPLLVGFELPVDELF